MPFYYVDDIQLRQDLCCNSQHVRDEAYFTTIVVCHACIVAKRYVLLDNSEQVNRVFQRPPHVLPLQLSYFPETQLLSVPQVPALRIVAKPL